jgi:uncharacterized protein YigA (DUF484 family)
MTTQSARGRRAQTLSDAEVAEFLKADPEFFERHQPLVATLKLPHLRHGGTTVSLVERQVDVLREKNRELDHKLQELVEVARGNDVLAAKIHRLSTRLISARGLESAVAVVEQSLREDFDVREFVIVLFRSLTPALRSLESRYLRFLERNNADVRTFEALFAKGKPRCGQVRDSQREWLFPSASTAIGSVALVPLGKDGEVGLLALAASDADRFNPTMSTEFLARIGELVAAALVAD